MFDRTRGTLTLFGILFLLPLPLSGQQTYVSRYDLYTGYAFLDSTKIGLFENGLHTQFGYRVKTWVSLGFDYSFTKGSMTLTPGLLPVALQQELGAQLGALAQAGLVPVTTQYLPSRPCAGTDDPGAATWTDRLLLE